MHFQKSIGMLIIAGLIIVMVGCSPKVGSDDWCNDMEKKPKGDWTVNEAADYAKHCIIR